MPINSGFYQEASPDKVPSDGAPGTEWDTESAVMVLRYDCTQVEVEDLEAARQMSSTETPRRKVGEDLNISSTTASK